MGPIDKRAGFDLGPHCFKIMFTCRYAQIPYFEDYFVLSNGQIWSRRSGKLLKIKPYYNSKGYERVRLYNDKYSCQYFVHRLVADAFCSKRPGANTVDHIDCNVENNHYTNLRWCTMQENMMNPISVERRINGTSKPNRMSIVARLDRKLKAHINQLNTPF